MLPTVPRAYTIDAVLADPIELNSRLGTYTNFVNLLDLAALAVPAACAPTACPFGITLIAPAGRDAALASLGRVFHADTGLPLGATGYAAAAARAVPALPADEVAIAVVGAHLSGMPLNGELRALDGRLLEKSITAPTSSSMHSTRRRRNPACSGSSPAQAAAMKLELEALSAAAFGEFVSPDAAAALDRHDPTGRRPRREGILSSSPRP